MEPLNKGVDIDEFISENKLVPKDKVIRFLNEIKKRESKSKPPTKWFNIGRKASSNRNTVFVIFLTQKNEMEVLIAPIYIGNLILIHHCVYELDPRCIYTMKKGLKLVKAFVIREIDRLPVNNLDIKEVEARKDRTNSDEFLQKLALMQRPIEKEKRRLGIGWGAIALIILAVVGVIYLYFTYGPK